MQLNFRNLAINSPEKLRSVLQKNPDLLDEQDEDGLTLLHHAAQIGPTLSSKQVGQVCDVLFNTPGINVTLEHFNAKAGNQNTPVHVAAIMGSDHTTAKYLFPTFVEEAEKRGFDFSTLGVRGRSVLQLATMTPYTRRFFEINNAETVIDKVKNPGLDVLSSSGSTAFFYAVNEFLFDEAKTLLDAGANPALYGDDEERNPFAKVDEQINTLSEKLEKNDPVEFEGYENRGKREGFVETVEKLKALKEQMESIVNSRKSSFGMR